MGLTINISNFSKNDFKGWGDPYCKFSLAFTDGKGSTPSQELQKMSGNTKMIATQDMLSSLGSDIFTMWLRYIDDEGHFFGIQCKQNAQVFGIGPRPSWQVLTPENKWKDQDSSEKYEWDYSDIKIVATPNSTHSSISIDVVIETKTK